MDKLQEKFHYSTFIMHICESFICFQLGSFKVHDVPITSFDWGPKEVMKLPINFNLPKIVIVPSSSIIGIGDPIFPNVLELRICHSLHVIAKGFDMLLDGSLSINKKGALISSIGSLNSCSKAMSLR